MQKSLNRPAKIYVRIVVMIKLDSDSTGWDVHQICCSQVNDMMLLAQGRRHGSVKTGKSTLQKVRNDGTTQAVEAIRGSFTLQLNAATKLSAIAVYEKPDCRHQPFWSVSY